MSQQINLLAPVSQKRFSFTSATAMSYGIGVAVALALLVAVYEDYRLRSIEAEARAVAASLKEAAVAEQKVSGEQVPRKPNAELEARLRELTVQLEARQEIIDALKSGAVGTTGGFSEYMRVFSRQSLEGLWLTSFDIAAGGNELTMAGRALSADLVPAYLQRLNREPPMQGRQFASMVINQSFPTREPATAPQQGKQAKEPVGRPRPPPHVEFVISSGAVADARSRAGASVTTPRGAPLPPSLSLREPVEAATRGARPGTAK